LADKLGQLEDEAFHLDQGHIYYLIARARNEVQSLVTEAQSREIETEATA
jgi:hypothetical protein